MKPSRRDFFLQTLAGLSAAGCAAATAKRPNVVLIVADDLGYGDLGCYGAPDIQTPNIDRLATEGIHFTDFHMNGPICTPSRVALLTGRYQQRTGLVTGIKPHDNDTRGLSLDERLLPEFLEEQGYASGIIGKWHLGRGKDFEYMPTRRGFGSFFGHPGGTMDYWTHKDQSGEDILYRDLEKVHEEGYATDLFGDEAVKFVQTHRNEPFFLYLPFNAPHTPLQTPDKPYEPFEPIMLKPRRMPDARPRFVKMVERMDENIGALLDALDECGLRDDTLVIFTSDNGGPEGSGRNEPFKGHKVSLYEGGQRVPFIARWPGRIPADSQYDGLCAGMDLFTTLIAMAGGAIPTDRRIDGVDLMPFLTGKSAKDAHEWLAWESHNEKFVRRGYRKGPWKLRMLRSVNTPPQETPVELYDLSVDQAETNNLADSRPEKLKEILRDLRTWERDVGIEGMIPDDWAGAS